ncbi:AEC family transporter [Hespellia stercorisuis]|uniref:AEC family transporter n=1 Tax=Hespellia stercorisuis DSM 15480 TaxID=1121950 RepID=A0A1M6Q7J3_9FIRM|nr:AEC family transporter [Hespellia stercorisuis]SHK16095.1 hypothetical protein SAMN02745243_02340 [Hespellia stercorisuis DSM 15480]
MDLSILLGEKIIGLALMGGVGYIIVKMGLLRAADSRPLSTVNIFILMPCMLVNAFQIDYTGSMIKGLALGVVVSIAIHIIMILLVYLIRKPLNLNSVEQASVIYSNAGNLVIPLVQSVLGPKWVLYTCPYIVVQAFFVWTHGKAMICHENKFDIKKVLLNPNIIAIFVGIILFFTRIKLPMIIGDVVTGFGNVVGPISMLVIGMLMGEVDIKWLFTRKRPYFVSFIRLIFLPLAVIVLMKISGIAMLHPEADQILMIVLMSAMAPIATMVTQIAQVYGGDATYAGALNVMSVLFCIVTMPAMLLFYTWLMAL